MNEVKGVIMNTAVKNPGKKSATHNKEERISFWGSHRGYTKGERWVIILTALLTLLGFLLRAWRIMREGVPLAFDGYYFQRMAKEVFFEGKLPLSEITRDPPGLTFILVLAEHLLGLPGKPLMWSIYLLPQIICSLQLIIFFVLARRLTRSRTIGLLSMLFMSFLGLIVYRNQNVAPETIVLGLVPFVVFYILRYLETTDLRFLLLALAITGGIVLTHHLSTLFVIVSWHSLLPYEIIYRLVKKEKLNKKVTIINVSLLLLMDGFIVVFWLVVLKGFPIEFGTEAFASAFTFKGATITMVIMIFAALILLAFLSTVLFYNLNNKKIRAILTPLTGTVGITVYIIAMIFGAGSPDANIWAGVLAGTPVILTPFLGFGVTSLPDVRKLRSRMLRGWVFGFVATILITAIIPMMSALLARLALYLIEAIIIVAAIAVMKICSKIETRKWKGITLIALTCCMALTMTYAYPKPKTIWGQQEFHYQAEFNTLDYLMNYSTPPPNTVWVDKWTIQVDCDFRLGLVVEGYSGFESTMGSNITSWLTNISLRNPEEREKYVTTVSPREFNIGLDYIFVSEVMTRDGYITSWANYGSNFTNWIIKLPEIERMVCYNPYIYRIYDNDITALLFPIWKLSYSKTK
ncbi:MAG: hypothetical protein GF308_15690 [Candidatus Heimdallarchaeota archaeon]|nr:hypothetical protein [Candidatus Heimdallarchaeota archaeon]